jgi:hypothetical protein
MSGDVWLDPVKSGGVGSWFGLGFAGPVGQERFSRGNAVHRRHARGKIDRATYKAAIEITVLTATLTCRDTP